MSQAGTAGTIVVAGNYLQAWDTALGMLRMETSKAYYDTWITPLQPLGYSDGIYRVAARSPYARDWVESRLKRKLTGLLEGALGERLQVEVEVAEEKAAAGEASTRREGDAGEAQDESGKGASTRKMRLQRAYGSQRAAVIQPERGMFLTQYLFNAWLPLLGASAFNVILAARSLCYWNPMTGELRNEIETDMSELAQRASVSVRTVKDVLTQELVRRYFLRYKVRRMMTPNGVRTAGILLQVRMDDPLTPEDQMAHDLPETERWYSSAFSDSAED